MTYSEKLRDPRWQKKRLEILSRDNWICRACQDDGSTLHVHHKFYIYGKEPWDYEDKAFITLCESCHETETADRKECEANLISGIRWSNLLSSDLQNLAGAFAEMRESHGVEVIVSALREAIINPLFQAKMLDLYFEYSREKRANHEAAKV